MQGTVQLQILHFALHSTQRDHRDSTPADDAPNFDTLPRHPANACRTRAPANEHDSLILFE